MTDTRRPVLLWHGDAACASGFAHCTHGALGVLHPEYETHVIGINYTGDPHPYQDLYKIYPAARFGRKDDVFGVHRLRELLPALNPDVTVLLNDPWNIPAYLPELKGRFAAAWLAVDGKNCRGDGLNGLDLAVFWTQFARDEARAGGYEGLAAVVPLGVDLGIYQPQDQALSRGPSRIGLPTHVRDKFIVGAVGRNQPRKRLDLTIAYFAEWIRSAGVDDAVLFLHVAPTGDTGYNIDQLVQYYGLKGRVVLMRPPNIGVGLVEAFMPSVYSCFDVQLSTTQGEGWGLCTMEGMACGVPQIVPDWAALGEWPGDAALKVPCTTVAHTPSTINVLGGVPDRMATVEALDRLYRDAAKRDRLRAAGLALVAQPRFRWENIGRALGDVLAQARAEWSPAPDAAREAVPA